MKEKNIITIKDIIDILVPIVFVFIICKFILMITVVQSESMEPTLMTGNTVIYNRLAYVFDDIKRGDIVVFYSKEFHEYLGKRIIGLPNDEIEFRDKYVIINGQYCDESDYIKTGIETNCEKKFIVPADSYFVLGDNRENSYDSRYWINPYIPKKDIKGRYLGQIDFSLQYDILHRFDR